MPIIGSITMNTWAKGGLTILGDYIVIAGGGGGGGSANGSAYGGGGGGAGGARSITGATISILTPYTVTVGTAGTAGQVAQRGGSGGASVFGAITSTGGGGGGASGANGTQAGIAGGSGGGGSNTTGGTRGAVGAGTAGQGNNGGLAPNSGGFRGGGGGGGIGSVGGAASGATGGTGGTGTTYWGISVSPGGAGGTDTSNSIKTVGADAITWGGGGGGSGGGGTNSTNGIGGAGYQGLVGLRYYGLPRSTAGNFITTDGIGLTYHYFTAVGTTSITLAVDELKNAGLFGTRYIGWAVQNPAFFTTATPTGETNQLTQISGFTSSADLYSWQWLGYFKAPATGNYTFTTTSDDESYLWVGAAAVTGFTLANANINNPIGTVTSGAIAMTEGLYYAIRLQFSENTGGDSITFSFTGPGIASTTDGTGYFFYNTITNGI